MSAIASYLPGQAELKQVVTNLAGISSMIPDFEFRCREVSAKYEDEVNKIFTDWIKHVAAQITPETERKRKRGRGISFKSFKSSERNKSGCC